MPAGNRSFAAEIWAENPSATVQDGAFRIVGLEPGEYDLEVTVDAAGKARATAAAGATDVRLRLPPSGTVSGRVLVAGGKPVTWASVQIQASGVKDGAPVENAMTNRTGRFTIRGVAEGSWTLTVHHQTAGRRWAGKAEIVVRANQTTTVPDLTLEDAGAADDEGGEDE